jgi:probable rRNA maturation factor
MKRKTRTAPPRTAIALIVEEKRWQKDQAALRLLRRAARLALGVRPLRSFGPPLPQAVEEKRKRVKIFPPPFKGEVLAMRAEGAQAVTILLSNDARLKSLNRDFRGRNKATNVLSFAADSPFYLGDIAIAYEKTAKEARAQKKSFSAHAAHLVMHGILHLFGHDHEDLASAAAMESLEAELLAKLGIADPYRPRPLTRAKKAA